MRPQERPRAGVPGGQLEDGRPVQAVNEYRIARLAMVGGDRDGRAAGMGGDQPAHRLGTDEGLVSQRDHRGGDTAGVASAERAQPGGQRGSHAGGPVGVVHGEHARQFHRDGSRHHDHGISTSRPEQRHPPFGKG